MEWHDTSCPRLDLFSSDGLDSCLGCGSFCTSTASLFPPLSKQSETRLLRLLPGNFTQDVYCEIDVWDLDSRPEYEAISYTWADETGVDDSSKTIFVSRKPLKVTRNCENALKRVRRFHSVRVVWIDAVCINQNDKNERGHQVQLMPRIYSSAKRVLIYIGERDANSDFCFKILDSGCMNSYDSVQTQQFCNSLSSLLRRQYFSRAWVLQEIALARKAIIICGDMEMVWEQLYNANWEFFPCRFEIQQLIDTSLLKIKQAELYTTPNRLLDLLDISRRCQARDPRDKVYALLGLIIDHRSLGLVADYNLTVKELYIKIALYLASCHDWTHVLFRAGTEHRAVYELPSWVPDWSCQFEKPPSLNDAHQLHIEATQYDARDNSLRFKASTVGFTDDPKVFFSTATSVEYWQRFEPRFEPQIVGYTDDLATFQNRYVSISSIIRQSYLFIPEDVLRHLESFPFLPDEKHYVSPRYYMQTSRTGSIGNQLTFAMTHIETLSDRHYFVQAQYIAASIRLTTVSAVSALLKSLTRTNSARAVIGNLWYDFLDLDEQDDCSSEKTWGLLCLTIEHKSRPLHDVDTLWRSMMSLDPHRRRIMRSYKDIGYDLLLDLNEAIWKLLVRLFLWRDIDANII
ncbi:HET-domain-containing protein [Xylaria scruposa]|nr:HET-domain-containing protein [Xylaria scruposa]